MTNEETSAGDVATARDPSTTPADTQLIPGEAATFADFIRSLDDGAVHARLTADLRSMAKTLHAIKAQTSAKVKGKLTIELNFTAEGDMVDIQPSVKSSEPRLPLARATRWVTPRDNFSAANPGQYQMFPKAV